MARPFPTLRPRLRLAAGVASLAFLIGACGGGEPAPRPTITARLTAFLERADPHPERTALLVGIDRYAEGDDRRFPDLAGCANDVRAMQRVLVERFGFEEHNVFTLLDEEATHAAILLAFHDVLLARASDGTEAFFYLAGHGSRIPDEGGWRTAEPDRLDSTFVAHDSRAEGRDGERDLVDDELRSLLAALCARTDRVTVITDCCHAGEITRGEERVRTAPRAARPLDRAWLAEVWPEGVPFTEDAPGEELPVARYLHLAAAERHERAWEVEVPEEEGATTHGAMTWLLVHALEHAPLDATWREIIDDVAVRVSILKPQTVNFRGTVDRRIFGGDGARVAGFRAEARSGGRLLVRAGWVHGLRVDSRLEVRDGRGEVVVGEAEVEAVDIATARARWIGETPDPLPPGAWRAIERTRGAGGAPLRVHVDDPERRARLDEGGGILVVEAAENADCRLRRTDGGGERLETLEGIAIQADGETFEAALAAELRWRALNLLAGDRGSLPVILDFRPARAEELASVDRPGLFHPVELLDPTLGRGLGGRRVRGGRALDPDEEERRLAAGEPPYNLGILEVTNPHDRALYVHVFSIEESRAIRPVLPHRRTRLLLEPGESVTQRLQLVLPRAWPLARAMRDRYVAIATLEPIDLSIFPHEPVLRGGETLTAPPPLIARAMEGPLLRGGEAAAIEPAGWGVTSLDLFVVAPDDE